MFGKGGMGNLMKQAQQMQEKMQSMQEEIANMEVAGESGGGMVKVRLNGKHELTRVEIDEAVMDDKEMLEDLVVAAVNSAVGQLASETQSRYSEVTGGMNIPGFKMPF